MRHFHRSSVHPDEALRIADEFFPTIGLTPTSKGARERAFGTLRLSVRMEGGHYTFIEVHTDQMGESRLDRNVKKYFVRVHRQTDPQHSMEAAY
jgi:hypothetical protein